MYYDDDDDDDPYAPRIGPAAMPSPRSKFAPYYSGCADSLEDFVEEFEALAYDCALTDPQRVDVIIRYVDPSIREFWKSLNGYRSRDWPLFQQSLVTIFGNPIPRHQIMRQKLHSHVQDSSRRRMDCEDDVLQYYRQFLCYSAPLVHAGHMSEEERDAAFWYGFHPEDRKVIQPRLLGKNPFQPSDVPFHFEDVLSCARAAFAYVDYFPSPWLHEQQFQSSSVRREQPVARHGSRDTYGLREVTRAIASNPETTTTPDELPLSSHSTPYTSSSSLSVSESQYTQAPSVTLDQPEPAHTFSTTLLPSASPPSHSPSLVHSATDNDLIPAPTSPIITSTLLPSASPTPFHTHLLAPSAAADVPEISSIHPLSSIMPASTMPSISSDFEYMPSETVDQPASTLSSTPPPSSSILPTFVRSAMNSQPEPEPTLASECLIPPSTGDVPEITSTPPSSSVSLTNLDCVPSAVVDNPEFEPEHASLSSITPTSPPLPAPSLPLEFTDDIREFLSPLPTPLSTSLACSEYSTSLSSPTNPSPSETPTSMPSDPHSIPAHSSWPLRSSSGDSSDTVVELVVVPVSLNPSKLSLSLGETIPPPDCSLASHPSPLSIEVSPLLEISTPDPLRPFELDSTPSPAVDIVPLSQPEPSWSSPCESVLLAPLEPIQCPPTLPQRPPGLQTVGSDSSALEVAPALALSTPQLEWQEPSPVCEAPSTLVPCLPHPTTSLLPSSLTHCDFAFALVTTAILVSTLLDILATLSTHSRKFWSKYEDFGNSQIGTLNTSSRDVVAQQLRLGQLTPRAPRLVFDPGGVFKFKRSSSRLPSAHEDVRKRMPKTRNGFITHVAIPVPVPIDNLVFDPGGQSSSSSVQVSRLLSAHEDVRKRKSKTCTSFTTLDTGHPYSHSSQQSHRFRSRRWSARVRAGTRGLGDA